MKHNMVPFFSLLMKMSDSSSVKSNDFCLRRLSTEDALDLTQGLPLSKDPERL